MGRSGVGEIILNFVWSEFSRWGPVKILSLEVWKGGRTGRGVGFTVFWEVVWSLFYYAEFCGKLILPVEDQLSFLY